MTDAREFIFGTDRVAVSRYKGYWVGPKRERMAVFLHSPDQIHRIEGAENVATALLEIDHVLQPSDIGWTELE